MSPVEEPYPDDVVFYPGHGYDGIRLYVQLIRLCVQVRRQLYAGHKVFTGGFLVQPDTAGGHFPREPVAGEDDSLVVVQSIEIVS